MTPRQAHNQIASHYADHIVTGNNGAPNVCKWAGCQKAVSTLIQHLSVGVGVKLKMVEPEQPTGP